MSLDFLKEAIGEVVTSNQNYCINKIENIIDKLQPFINEVDQNPKQDESVFVFIYYRKWSDMESHSSRAEIIKYCNDIDNTLAESRFEKLKNWYQE